MKTLILMLLCSSLGLLAAACGTSDAVAPNPPALDETDPPAPEETTGETETEPVKETEEPVEVTEPAEPEKPVVSEEPPENKEPAEREKPEVVFHVVKAAFAKDDFSTVFKRLSAQSVDQLRARRDGLVEMLKMVIGDEPNGETAARAAAMLEQFGVSSVEELAALSPEDFFIMMMKSMRASTDTIPMADTELIEVEEGDDANTAVLITKDGKGRDDRMNVVWEDGEWKLDMPGGKRAEVEPEEDE